MTKKIVTMLVILSLFGVSAAYAHDSGYDNDAAGAAIVAGLAFVTAAFLIASHDNDREYCPPPRHSPGRSYDSKGNDKYRDHDGGYGDHYQSRDNRYNDNNRYDGRYQGEYRGGRTR